MLILKIKGGLGNQLFQYATAKQFSLIHQNQLFLDLSFYKNEKFLNIFRLDRYNFEINYADPPEIHNMKEKGISKLKMKFLNKLFLSHTSNEYLLINDINFLHYSNKLNISPKITILDGWFANPNYFQNIRHLLLQDFTLKTISSKTKHWSDLIKERNSVAIHIRRNDYISSNYFNQLSTSYYNEALKYINSKIDNPTFFFFSDDLEWVKKNFSFLSNSFFVDINIKKQNYYSTYSDTEDLYLLSLCKHQIMANSTFSWWGAWLNMNANKIVIAPKIWYRDKNAQNKYSNSEFVPYNWIKI
jgi:hypothetical protein